MGPLPSASDRGLLAFLILADGGECVCTVLPRVSLAGRVGVWKCPPDGLERIPSGGRAVSTVYPGHSAWGSAQRTPEAAPTSLPSCVFS